MKDHPSYRILDLLGTSPTTEVHRAWDDSPLQRDVAIKMLRGDAAAVEHVRRQFWERVKAMADLRHERLLPVFSTDTERDWVILELADDNAAARIARGPVPAGEVQSYLAQILEGLEALHAKGRLHGRIKPSNLLLYKSGRLKIADPGALVDGDLQLVPGAEKYLAPELADSTGRFGAGRPGPGLDLYGAAFCALEMLAGPKFDGMFPGMTAGGADTAALWWKWHASAADPRELVDKLVPASAGRLREALRSMLAKPVAERADSARAVLDTLGTAAIPEEIRVDAASATVPAAAAVVSSGDVESRAARVSEIRHDGGSRSAAGSNPSRPAGAASGHRVAAPPASGRRQWVLPAVAAGVWILFCGIGLVAWREAAARRDRANIERLKDVVRVTSPIVQPVPSDEEQDSTQPPPNDTTAGQAKPPQPVARTPSADDLSEGILQ
jgi:serine/threonine protein kinase